jgi:hypothetical protein
VKSATVKVSPKFLLSPGDVRREGEYRSVLYEALLEVAFFLYCFFTDPGIVIERDLEVLHTVSEVKTETNLLPSCTGHHIFPSVEDLLAGFHGQHGVHHP